MTTDADNKSAGLPCHTCAYDLRAHPADGKCPECGASVAEARRLAAIPRRPAWRDSDPRWRRRMLAGVWVLVFLPLMDALTAFGLASSVPVPQVFDLRSAIRSLEDTLLNSFPGVYQPLVFCIGVVLLFSKERERRPSRLDWTRRWGILCTYAVFLLSAAQFLSLVMLVLIGIAALLMSMPLIYQPGLTEWFVEIGVAYIYYGPNPNDFAGAVQVAFASGTVLLACVPLFDALRSSGPKRLAAILLAPLALFAVMHLVQVGRYCLDLTSLIWIDIYLFGTYFCPTLLIGGEGWGLLAFWGSSGSAFSGFLVEATKWCIVLTIAVWLSIAQVAAWRKSKELNRGLHG